MPETPPAGTDSPDDLKACAAAHQSLARQVRAEHRDTRQTLGTGMMWIGVQVVIAGWALGGHFFPKGPSRG